MRAWKRLFYLVVVGAWFGSIITGICWVTWLLYTDLSVWAAIFFVSFVGTWIYEVNNDER